MRSLNPIMETSSARLWARLWWNMRLCLVFRKTSLEFSRHMSFLQLLLDLTIPGLRTDPIARSIVRGRNAILEVELGILLIDRIQVRLQLRCITCDNCFSSFLSHDSWIGCRRISDWMFNAIIIIFVTTVRQSIYFWVWLHLVVLIEIIFVRLDWKNDCDRTITRI